MPLPAYSWQEERFWWPESMVRGSPAIASSEVEARVEPKPGARHRGADGIAYCLRWEPLAPLEPDPPEARTPAVSGAELEAICEQLADASDVDDYAAIEPEVDAVCAAYAARALVALGVEFVPAYEVSPKQLAEQNGSDSSRLRLLDYLCEILATEGWLVPHGESWSVARSLPEWRPDQRRARLPGVHELLEQPGHALGHHPLALHDAP